VLEKLEPFQAGESLAGKDSFEASSTLHSATGVVECRIDVIHSLTVFIVRVL
jgi:hypothetical protein